MIGWISSLFTNSYEEKLAKLPHVGKCIKKLSYDLKKQYTIDVYEPSSVIIEKMLKFKTVFSTAYEKDVEELCLKLSNEPQAYNDQKLIEIFIRALSGCSMEQYDHIYLMRSNKILVHLYNQQNRNKNLVVSLNHSSTW